MFRTIYNLVEPHGILSYMGYRKSPKKNDLAEIRNRKSKYPHIAMIGIYGHTFYKVGLI